MEVLFLGVAVSTEKIKQFDRYYIGKKNAPHPQNIFDYNVVSGLSANCKVMALSMLPVNSLPGSSCVLYMGQKEKISNNLCIKYLFTLNLPIVKYVFHLVEIFFFSFFFLLCQKRHNRVIITGYISVFVTLPARLVSLILGAKLIAIVPDVPHYMNTYSKSKNFIKAKLLQFVLIIDEFLQTQYDGYVLLTQSMADLLQIRHKKYVVIEGMISPKDFIINESEEIQKENAIMYAGTLHKKFGIEKLVKSFMLANINNCKLWILGNGDYLQELKEYCSKNDQIKYLGMLPRDEVLRLEKKAMLLVNPRPSDELFTKYSFPSKTLEYMASGTPLLTTNLSGIPEEYWKYLFRFEAEDEISMADTLSKVCFDKAALYALGNDAKEFVLKNKNITVQTKRIFAFIQSISL